MWTPSRLWTADDRLRLIAIVARHIRDRTMRGLPYNEVGTPNAETIRGIAEESAATLESMRVSVEDFLRADERWKR